MPDVRNIPNIHMFRGARVHLKAEHGVDLLEQALHKLAIITAAPQEKDHAVRAFLKAFPNAVFGAGGSDQPVPTLSVRVKLATELVPGGGTRIFHKTEEFFLLNAQLLDESVTRGVREFFENLLSGLERIAKHRGLTTRAEQYRQLMVELSALPKIGGLTLSRILEAIRADYESLRDAVNLVEAARAGLTHGGELRGAIMEVKGVADKLFARLVTDDHGIHVHFPVLVSPMDAEAAYLSEGGLMSIRWTEHPTFRDYQRRVMRELQEARALQEGAWRILVGPVELTPSGRRAREALERVYRHIHRAGRGVTSVHYDRMLYGMASGRLADVLREAVTTDVILRMHGGSASVLPDLLEKLVLRFVELSERGQLANVIGGDPAAARRLTEALAGAISLYGAADKSYLVFLEETIGGFLQPGMYAETRSEFSTYLERFFGVSYSDFGYHVPGTVHDIRDVERTILEAYQQTAEQLLRQRPTRAGWSGAAEISRMAQEELRRYQRIQAEFLKRRQLMESAESAGRTLEPRFWRTTGGQLVDIEQIVPLGQTRTGRPEIVVRELSLAEFLASYGQRVTGVEAEGLSGITSIAERVISSGVAPPAQALRAAGLGEAAVSETFHVGDIDELLGLLGLVGDSSLEELSPREQQARALFREIFGFHPAERIGAREIMRTTGPLAELLDIVDPSRREDLLTEYYLAIMETIRRGEPTAITDLRNYLLSVRSTAIRQLRSKYRFANEEIVQRLTETGGVSIGEGVSEAAETAADVARELTTTEARQTVYGFGVGDEPLEAMLSRRESAIIRWRVRGTVRRMLIPRGMDPREIHPQELRRILQEQVTKLASMEPEERIRWFRRVEEQVMSRVGSELLDLSGGRTPSEAELEPIRRRVRAEILELMQTRYGLSLEAMGRGIDLPEEAAESVAMNRLRELARLVDADGTPRQAQIRLSGGRDIDVTVLPGGRVRLPGGDILTIERVSVGHTVPAVRVVPTPVRHAFLPETGPASLRLLSVQESVRRLQSDLDRIGVLDIETTMGFFGRMSEEERRRWRVGRVALQTAGVDPDTMVWEIGFGYRGPRRRDLAVLQIRPRDNAFSRLLEQLESGAISEAEFVSGVLQVERHALLQLETQFVRHHPSAVAIYNASFDVNRLLSRVRYHLQQDIDATERGILLGLERRLQNIDVLDVLRLAPEAMQVGQAMPHLTLQDVARALLGADIQQTHTAAEDVRLLDRVMQAMASRLASAPERMGWTDVSPGTLFYALGTGTVFDPAIGEPVQHLRGRLFRFVGIEEFRSPSGDPSYVARFQEMIPHGGRLLPAREVTVGHIGQTSIANLQHTIAGMMVQMPEQEAARYSEAVVADYASRMVRRLITPVSEGDEILEVAERLGISPEDVVARFGEAARRFRISQGADIYTMLRYLFRSGLVAGAVGTPVGLGPEDFATLIQFSRQLEQGVTGEMVEYVASVIGGPVGQWLSSAPGHVQAAVTANVIGMTARYVESGMLRDPRLVEQYLTLESLKSGFYEVFGGPLTQLLDITAREGRINPAEAAGVWSAFASATVERMLQNEEIARRVRMMPALALGGEQWLRLVFPRAGRSGEQRIAIPLGEGIAEAQRNVILAQRLRSSILYEYANNPEAPIEYLLALRAAELGTPEAVETATRLAAQGRLQGAMVLDALRFLGINVDAIQALRHVGIMPVEITNSAALHEALQVVRRRLFGQGEGQEFVPGVEAMLLGLGGANRAELSQAQEAAFYNVMVYGFGVPATIAEGAPPEFAWNIAELLGSEARRRFESGRYPDVGGIAGLADRLAQLWVDTAALIGEPTEATNYLLLFGAGRTRELAREVVESAQGELVSLAGWARQVRPVVDRAARVGEMRLQRFAQAAEVAGQLMDLVDEARRADFDAERLLRYYMERFSGARTAYIGRRVVSLDPEGLVSAWRVASRTLSDERARQTLQMMLELQPELAGRYRTILERLESPHIRAELADIAGRIQHQFRVERRLQQIDILTDPSILSGVLDQAMADGVQQGMEQAVRGIAEGEAVQQAAEQMLEGAAQRVESAVAGAAEAAAAASPVRRTVTGRQIALAWGGGALLAGLVAAGLLAMVPTTPVPTAQPEREAPPPRQNPRVVYQRLQRRVESAEERDQTGRGLRMLSMQPNTTVRETHNTRVQNRAKAEYELDRELADALVQ